MTAKFNRGDIVLITFPFSDLSTTKLRPAVIISADPVVRDATFAFITSLKPAPFGPADLTLPASDETGLKRESYVRFNKVATLELGKVKRQLGKIPTDLKTAVDEKLSAAFGLAAK